MSRAAKMEPDKLVDNVGDPEQVTRGQTKANVIEKRRRDRWDAQLETREGRAVIWDILDECGAFQNAFAETDAQTNHNTGRQAIGHFILAEIHKSRPNALVEMMIENAKEKSL